MDSLFSSAEDTLFIGAAGNSNTTRIHYPSGYDDVFSVAATDGRDYRAGFSNYGDSVEI